MKRTLCLLSALVLAPLAGYAGDEEPGELTDPTQILEKVDAAAKAVKAIKYDVVFEATGMRVRQLGGIQKIEASYIVSGFVGGAPEKYVVNAKMFRTGAKEPRRVTAGTDNDMFYIVDHQGKIAYEDLDPAVMGRAGAVVQLAGMIEFVHPTPFSDELNGKSRELKGSEKVGDEDCYIVHVVYAAPQAPQGTWSFSKKDFLPRRRIDVTGGPGNTQIKTITNLVIDPKVDDEVFKLKLPEGYSKTDDFAPNFLVSTG